MSDVSTTGVVSFHTDNRSIFSYGSGRPDANSLLFGAGGHEHILLSIEVNELSLTSRVIRKVAQDELSAMEQSRVALFHQDHFQLAVREHQRLVRDAVSQPVFDSVDRFETTLSIELRQAQFNNESTMQQRGTRYPLSIW